MSSLYHNYNYNPKNKYESDCVIRSICAVTGDDWTTVFDELCAIGRKNYTMPNSKPTYEEYLKKHGFKWTYLKIVKGQKRISVKQFASKNKKGKYILNVANHMVAVVNGTYIDTWDSGDYRLYGYWSK